MPITKSQLKRIIRNEIIKEQFSSELPHDLTDLSNLVQVCHAYSRLSPEAQQQLKLLMINGVKPQNWVAQEITKFLDVVTRSGGISDASDSQAEQLKKALSFLG